MQHAFLYISLPSLHYCNVKVPNLTFCRGLERRQRLSFSFPELWYSLSEFNSRKICQHLTNWTSSNKRDKVWSSANSLFKWRFRRRRRPCCSSSLSLCQSLEQAKIIYFKKLIRLIWPFPSSPWPLFQNGGRCSAFDMETHFHKKGCAPSLVLKVRVFGTRKRPIIWCNTFFGLFEG